MRMTIGSFFRMLEKGFLCFEASCEFGFLPLKRVRAFFN
ncbi:hypothetical protein RV02_GL004080 [Enterococcus gilvus]|nr:hypothetical protein RV02_GL004080 [Enterococcus gilvus]